MARRVVWYGVAAALSAAVVAGGLGPFRCDVYGCTGGANTTLHTFVVGAAVGAAAGLVVMALIDAVVNGRYFLANRTEARARRKRDERRTGPSPHAARHGDAPDET